MVEGDGGTYVVWLLDIAVSLRVMLDESEHVLHGGEVDRLKLSMARGVPVLVTSSRRDVLLATFIRWSSCRASKRCVIRWKVIQQARYWKRRQMTYIVNSPSSMSGPKTRAAAMNSAHEFLVWTCQCCTELTGNELTMGVDAALREGGPHSQTICCDSDILQMVNGS